VLPALQVELGKMWIKICGMTTAEGVQAVLDAGVDAVGFVFTDSVRKLTPQAAAELALPARGRAAVIAVARHPSQALVDEIMRVFAPEVLQTDAADFLQLSLPAHVGRLPVFRAAPAEPVPERLLFEGAVSGSGMPCDWAAAAQLARRSQLVLAGGLSEHNVGQAIESVRPHGVDVSSGVEDRPGIKSTARIARFVERARVADAGARGVGTA
jgi:phosphoribosylanthranilate isomerase